VGFDVAYLGKNRKPQKRGARHLPQRSVSCFLLNVQNRVGGLHGCFFFLLGNLHTFQTRTPSRVLGRSVGSGSALRGKALAWQSGPGSALRSFWRPALMLGGRLPPSELPHLRSPHPTCHLPATPSRHLPSRSRVEATVWVNFLRFKLFPPPSFPSALCCLKKQGTH